MGIGWVGHGKSVLNFTSSAFLSSVDRGSILMDMAVPWDRALGGRLVRKRRTDLDLGEKGLILVATSVMNLVIILSAAGRMLRASIGWGCLVR